MTNLPDLDTSNVSYLAYWNAIEQGGIGSISPEEVVSQEGVTEYTLYDNGVVGKFDLSVVANAKTGDTDMTQTNGIPSATFRVKSDGWFTVYVDDTENFKLDHRTDSQLYPMEIPPEVNGWWNVCPIWAQHRNGQPDANIADNGLSYTIRLLQAELSNSGNISFQNADVGLYNYQYEQATNSTTLSTYRYYNDGGGAFEFTYTDSTDLHAAVATAACSDNDYQGNSTSIDFGGTQMAYGQNNTGFGTWDLLANGVIPNSETQYGHTINHGSGDAHAATFFLWS